MKVAVFPGSFDPITIGHQDIVERSVVLFDQIIVGIGTNTQKRYLYPIEKRIEWVEAVFSHLPNVKIMQYQGLTVNFCKSIGAKYLIRGIRSASDFEYEKTIAHLNHMMDNNLETLLMLSPPEYSSISSTIVREILLGHGDVEKFVPKQIASDLMRTQI